MKTALWTVPCLVFLIQVSAGAEPILLHVSINGNDVWSGQLAESNGDQTDGPVASIRRAQKIVRELLKKPDIAQQGVEVLVHPGTYQVERTIEFNEEDSGSNKTQVVYRADSSGTVRLLGGCIIKKWERVTDSTVLNSLDPSARGNVFQADLKSLGIEDYGSPASGGLELFCGGKPMTLARWPNSDFVRIDRVLGKTEVNVRGTKGCREGLFEFQNDRPKRWSAELDPWVHGYWFWDWAEQRHGIKSIDTKNHVIELKRPFHNYGYRKGQWFYAFNLFSEIDQSGEWYLDRDSGTLYFWPPQDLDKTEVIVSVLPTLVTMKDVSHVTLRGFTFEGVRGTAISISGGENNRVEKCTISNIGGWGVTVSGGKTHGVVGCDMYQMGSGGISLSGGNRKTLSPAGHFADNNHIHHYARIERVYRSGIVLQGVGNRATHNLIHNAPHMAINFGGNDHVIEFNEIHSVCFESNDAGAIYAGRNWTARGTAIRNNYMHHCNGFEGRGCVGVYLDDMYCGTEISGNLFYRVTRAAFVGGGRDCLIENNLFVDCRPSIHIDGRALGWAKYHADQWVKEGQEKGTLSGTRFKEPPYSVRYPKLPNILNDEPFAPKGNVVQHNVSIGGKWDGVYAVAKKYQTIRDNLIDQDPLFATPNRIGEGKQPQAKDFELKQNSPAWSIGFKQLPLEEMGLYKDDLRASWPVKHIVRGQD